MMHGLIQHIYISHAAASFEEHEIPELLRQIRPNNAKNGVTGMLVYTGTAFLQVLEGGRADVNALFDRIFLDRRHMRVTSVVHEALGQRQFNDWTMDFVTIDAADVDDIVGGPSFLTSAPGVHLQPARIKRLIAALRKPSWQNEPRAIEAVARSGSSKTA
jgi:hypothetical protein